MSSVITKLLYVKDGIALVEYTSIDHPERVFYEILQGWKEIGIVPMIVDVWDTLHIFIQNLKFAGMDIELSNVPVIK